MNFSLKSLALVVGLSVMPLVAVPTLRITDCGTDGICSAGEIAGATVVTAANGNISFNGAVGTWDLNVVSALTKTTLGSALIPRMSMTSQNQYGGTGTGLLQMEFTETGFTGTPGQLVLGTSSSTLNTTLDIFSGAKFDATDALYGGSLGAADSVDFNGTGFTGVFSDVRSALSPYSDDGTPGYSLTTVLRLSGTNGEFANMTADLAAVPEPGFYGSLALGLSGVFAVVAHRRRKANAE